MPPNTKKCCSRCKIGINEAGDACSNNLCGCHAHKQQNPTPSPEPEVCRHNLKIGSSVCTMCGKIVSYQEYAKYHYPPAAPAVEDWEKEFELLPLTGMTTKDFIRSLREADRKRIVEETRLGAFGEIVDLLEKRCKKWHEYCLIDEFTNGRFWEAKEIMTILTTSDISKKLSD